MDILNISTEEAVDRVVESLRVRLLEARRQGQTVRMSARESGSTTMSVQQFERSSVQDVLARVSRKRYDIYIQIGD